MEKPDLMQLSVAVLCKAVQKSACTWESISEKIFSMLWQASRWTSIISIRSQIMQKISGTKHSNSMKCALAKYSSNNISFSVILESLQISFSFLSWCISLGFLCKKLKIHRNGLKIRFSPCDASKATLQLVITFCFCA